MAGLESIRVLELASVLAGPLAATALAERGAQVTKVERPPHGDVTRSWKTASESEQADTSAYYESANGDKTLIWQDLNTPEGGKWLDGQLAVHDVLIQNFKASDLEKFNLEPEKLAKRYPRLIHVRLVGFADAPERLAYDVVVQAETGFMHMNGFEDRPPVRMPVALMDVLASHQIRMAVLEGLLERANGGVGFYAEVSLQASGITALVNQATNHLIAHSNPTRNGGLHPNIAPYGDLLVCEDGHVVLAVGNDRQFESLCQTLEAYHLPEQTAYKTNQQRVRNRNRLMVELNAAAMGWKKETLESQLRQVGVPAGVVRSVAEVFEPGSSGWDWTVENPSGLRRPKAVGYTVERYR